MSAEQATEDVLTARGVARGRARCRLRLCDRLPLTAELWALAWPAILRNVLNCACDRLTLALVGHYDPSIVHYDGAGLGKMYSNITGLSVGLGLNLGLATLCSQAYGAGRAAEENALHLRRCAVWLVVAFAYSAAACAFAEHLLRLAAQPADVAAASAAYARVQLPGVPLYWAANALQTVCDGLQDTRPGLWSNLVSAAVQVAGYPPPPWWLDARLLFVCLCGAHTHAHAHTRMPMSHVPTQVALSVLFVHPRLGGMGYLGMAAARSCGGAVCLLLMVLLIRRAKLQPLVWRLPPPPTSPHSPPASSAGAAARVLSGAELLRFIKLALPSACVMWIEW